MRPTTFLFGAALAALSPALARSSTGDRVLVVLESQVKQDDYSKLWASLKARGFELTFKDPKDGSAELIRHGETQYDHLIMYAPSTKSFATPLQPKAIVEAQFAGVNTLYLLSSDITEFSREALREYDVEFTSPGTAYLDGFSHVYDSSPALAFLNADSLVANGGILSPLDGFGNYRGGLVYPSGAAHTTGENAFLIDVLKGRRTGYTGKDVKLDADEAEVEAVVGKLGKEPVLAGREVTLVSAMQTRDNVRIGFVGAGEMFSDKWWDAEAPIDAKAGAVLDNKLFAEDFTKWIFQETGVVKVVATHHHRAGETEPREFYTKKDDLTFTLTLSQHTTTANGTSTWTAFDATDLQLDFTMLDPHVRTALTKDPLASTDSATTYKARFKAPDRHGVFKFVVEYWRPGWSYIRSSSTASVVPLRHDEYEKFTTGAWPYYTSTLSLSAAFLLFCGLWLAIGEEDKKGKKKAE